jgi:Xaa-Pro dipeptidase
MPELKDIQKSLGDLGLAGWFLCNIAHRDEIADAVLGVPRDRSNSRPWACVLSPDRPPVKIVHRIEAGILDHVPGRAIPYYTREEFLAAVKEAVPRAGSVAADYSAIPVGSFLDHGTARLLQSLGVALVPSEDLVARTLGALDDGGRRSHEAAARVLYTAVSEAWAVIARGMREGRAVTEGDARDRIMGVITAAGLAADGPPIAGAGIHTSDPHFQAAGRGAVIARGDVVQFDLWAKEQTPGAVFADISWVGVCDAVPAREHLGAFDAVRAAREAAVSLLQSRFTEGAPVSGADVDRAARAVLIDRGYGPALRHRTGHSIGARVHGYGVNLDSVEFPDERLLVEGACFSVEPGVYLEGFGMRTEIDCYVHGGRVVVSGGPRQDALLTLG